MLCTSPQRLDTSPDSKRLERATQHETLQSQRWQRTDDLEPEPRHYAQCEIEWWYPRVVEIKVLSIIEPAGPVIPETTKGGFEHGHEGAVEEHDAQEEHASDAGEDIEPKWRV